MYFKIGNVICLPLPLVALRLYFLIPLRTEYLVVYCFIKSLTVSYTSEIIYNQLRHASVIKQFKFFPNIRLYSEDFDTTPEVRSPLVCTTY